MKTLLDLIRQPLVIGAFVLSILIVVGAYFGSHWYYGDDEPVPEELLNYKPEPAVSRGDPEVSKGRLPRNDDSATRRVSTRSDDAAVAVDETDNLDDFEYTPVYYFSDGTPVPEHILCPEKWIGVYLTDLSESELFEVMDHTDAVASEIIQNYNPNRPLADIWPRYIEAEKDLLSQSNAVLSDLQSPLAARQIDWGYEQAYRFPEIQALRLDQDTSGRMQYMYLVDMGQLDPDWNLIELPDGRDFRVKHGRQYTFRTSKTTQGEGTTDASFTICFSDPGTAENIVIENYEQVSDAELERLGGWNYNYNPYTEE